VQIENLHHYVFVRQDISVRQQAVQSNHATFLLARTLPHTIGTPNLVLIGVPDAAALRAVMQTLDTNNIEYVAYEEPANDMGLSSVATVPLGANDRLCLSGFKTWKPIELGVQVQSLPLAPILSTSVAYEGSTESFSSVSSHGSKT